MSVFDSDNVAPRLKLQRAGLYTRACKTAKRTKLKVQRPPLPSSNQYANSNYLRFPFVADFFFGVLDFADAIFLRLAFREDFADLA